MFEIVSYKFYRIMPKDLSWSPNVSGCRAVWLHHQPFNMFSKTGLKARSNQWHEHRKVPFPVFKKRNRSLTYYINQAGKEEAKEAKRNRRIAPTGFDPVTSGLWARRASAAPTSCSIDRVNVLWLLLGFCVLFVYLFCKKWAPVSHKSRTRR